MARLGILGGGQLARMLAEEALVLGIEVSLLTARESDPAAIGGVEVITGRLDDAEALERLFRRCGRVAIENEFLDVSLLRSVMKHHPEAVLVPTPEAIAVAQDKLRQKELFESAGVPSAGFAAVDSPEDVNALLNERFAAGCVLKWSRFGYDGKGNRVVPPGGSDPAGIERFFENAAAKGARVYAEELIPFDFELAQVATRGLDGAMVHYPLVYSEQENGVCRAVRGPAVKLGLDTALEDKAAGMMEAVAGALDLHGTFALEFFHSAERGLLVNELAPRVHNTGHYSYQAGWVSQFENHVRAVCGLPLRPPEFTDWFGMRNLLGPRGVRSGTPCEPPVLRPPEGVELYWYGKKSVSPGRKMGHLNGRARSADELQRLLDDMERFETRLWAAKGDA